MNSYPVAPFHSSIVSPTCLQATRNADGSFTAIVSTHRNDPAYGFITVEDYLSHERRGAIDILSRTDRSGGFTRVSYVVN